MKGILELLTGYQKGVEEAFIREAEAQLTDHVVLAHCEVVMSFDKGDFDKAFDDFLKEKQGLNYEEMPLAHLWHFNQN